MPYYYAFYFTYPHTVSYVDCHNVLLWISLLYDCVHVRSLINEDGCHDMDTRYLHFFVECARMGSLTGAAKKLIISQQGMSAAISRLEAELQCKLFERTAAGVELTDHGRFFMPRAEKILALEEECKQCFSDRKEKRKVAVAYTFGVVGLLWEQVFLPFQEANPDIHIAIHEYPDSGCELALENGTAEIALLAGPIDGGKFESRCLFKQRICLIAHRSHPLAESEEIGVEHLRSEPMIILNENFRMNRQFVEACNSAGFEPKIVNKAAEIALVHKLVERRMGLGLSLDYICSDMPSPSISVKTMAIPGFSWDLNMAVKKRESLSPEASLLMNYIGAHYK